MTSDFVRASTDTHVRSTIDQRIGRILLDRPAALNALDLPMIRATHAALNSFTATPTIHAIAITGAGGRAFCAGGDIRAIRAHALANEMDDVRAFFAEEYALNAAIAACPVPYIALIDGICMGGGIGVSVHGQIRVATEAATFAMPETAIGFFPDIGASFFLPRLPGALGLYLGLTGTRVTGADAVHAGLATHFVPRDRLAQLNTDLATNGPAAIATHAAPLPPFTLAPHRAAIDRCFSQPTIEAILQALESERTDWATTTLATLRAMSPASLLWSHQLITAGATRTLQTCLDAELALALHVTRHPDFAEGVRAMVVDKDRKPRWTHASVEAVPEAEINKLFE
jgi:enoyl-CoA hydratase/carnithine racemase